MSIETDNIHINSVSLYKGIEKACEAIKQSYGPHGSNVIIEEDLYPFHRVTNDGKLIVEKIKLADRIEQIGVNLLKEVADKTDRESGDGRKTSMLLTQAILNKALESKKDLMVIKRELNDTLPKILDEIDKTKKEITVNEVEMIATIASENKFLGEVFAEIYSKIGRDGIVDLDNSGLPTTSYEIRNGVKLLNCGFMYPYMANSDKGRQAVYLNPKILIVKDKLSHINQFEKIVKELHNRNINELVIFCDEIELSVSQNLAQIHLGVQKSSGETLQFKTLVIKAPALWKDWLYDDFSKITGATIMNSLQGTSLKTFRFEHLGTCEKIITTKDDTIVLGIKDITEHLEKLKEDNTNDAKIRIARLQTKTGILKLGAGSEIELSYLWGKATDARNSSYLALQEGVVKGAGQCLYEISEKITNPILKYALKVPYELISSSGKISKDVYDPVIVVKNALKNAVSVASTVLTSPIAVTK